MPESYVQRAELLADLGRYDEAAAELAAADPSDALAHTLLARIRLAAGEPKPALAAADAALKAASSDLDAMIARGMALADLGRVDEAAEAAQQILRRGRGNGYACTSAAAILAEVRAGQVALDAAWEGVWLTPEAPRAHLVLGVIAARLGLDEIAERAYQEALAIDPQLSVAQTALGVARVEQHRYAAVLSRFVKPARFIKPAKAARASRDAIEQERDGGESAAEGAEVPEDLRRLMSYGVGYALVAPLLVAGAHAYEAAAPLVALLLAGIGIAGTWLAWRRVAPDLAAEQVRTNRRLAVAGWTVLSVPSLLLVYALFGSPLPLVLAAAAGLVAMFALRPVRTG